MDETTALADLVLPSHTYLESWGDDFPEPGVGFPVGAIAQPVVSPLVRHARERRHHPRLSRNGSVSATRCPGRTWRTVCRQGWREIHQRGAPRRRRREFRNVLERRCCRPACGGRTRTAPGTRRLSVAARDRGHQTSMRRSSPERADAYPFFLHPYLSDRLHDGRGANLPWMQELPDPLTSVVYGSWVELNPKTATATRGRATATSSTWNPMHGRITAPVFVYPGDPARRRRHADRTGTWRVRPLRAASRCQSDSDPGSRRSSRRPALSPGARRA